MGVPRPVGRPPDNATMVRHAGYRFRARWATRWHEGRIFLAGDAAHQTPPFAGQGMCAGLRDAANLAWKLDYALGHPGATALLDTYDTERIPHAAAVIEVATELGQVICIPTWKRLAPATSRWRRSSARAAAPRRRRCRPSRAASSATRPPPASCSSRPPSGPAGSRGGSTTSSGRGGTW